jgi:hypothetical protein
MAPDDHVVEAGHLLQELDRLRRGLLFIFNFNVFVDRRVRGCRWRCRRLR